MDQIGKYEVLDKIGAGGFAVVYKGYDPFIKRPVAIKVCFSRDQETRQRFFREAEIAGRLVHRNLTTVYDFGLHDQMPYLVEEYLSGEDLAHMIRRREPETLEEKLDYLLQIASGLEYAHAQGVIHRDIKPSNVRVLDSGRVKIMDFGTAKLAHVESTLTQSGMTLGTVAYLSPERLLGEPTGPNSDVFSYGVLAYELLTFRRPFSGRNIPGLIENVLQSEPPPVAESWPEDFSPSCPPRLADVVHRCLEKDPQRRFPSCRAVTEELEQVRLESTVQIPLATADGGTHADVRQAGLLEHARELVDKGRFTRAELLLDEVLELAPDHGEAQRLRERCRRAVDGTADDPPSADEEVSEPVPIETAEERQARKVGEAVASVESSLRTGEIAEAAAALAFATRLLGSFPESRTLRRRLAEALRDEVTMLVTFGRRQAASIVARMKELRDRDRLPAELAESFAELVAELHPQDREAASIVASARATNRPTLHAGEAQDRRRDEAVASIEKLLDDGQIETAEEALAFARRLYGDFRQASSLEERIASARAGVGKVG